MDFKQITTTCPYCGTGCSINLVVKNGKVIKTAPYFRSPVNEGKVCPKGTYSYQFINSIDRIRKPLIRKGDVFVESDWDKAYHIISERLKTYKPDEIAVLSSARCSNEDNYIMMKFARGVLRTGNIDHCARLCHASTVAGLSMAFGNGAMTNSIPDIAESDCVFCLGSNTFEQHPLIGRKIMRAKSKSAKLICVDPRYTPTARQADLYMQPFSGSDVAILNCIMGEIIRNGWEDSEFIEKRTKGYDTLKKVVLRKKYTPDSVSNLTGIPQEQLQKAAKIIGKAKRCTLLYSMGITQHTIGVDNVKSIANLMMLTGNLGKPGTGVNALRGQNNVQGACDMGCLPNFFTGYQKVTNGPNHKKFSDYWGFPDGICTPKQGYEITTMFNILRESPEKLRAMYLMGENPLVSEPDIKAVEQGIKNLDFLVVQDIFFTETCQYADVVLPAACYAEKDGTQTNTERRVQRLRKAQEPPGEAKADWQIVCELACHMGYSKQFNYKDVNEIFNEIAELTPQYHGMNYERINLPGGVQWPCPNKKHPGTAILYEQKFDHTDGKGVFLAVERKEPRDLPDENYPYRFNTGRIIWHWHTGTMTRRSKNLNDEVNSAYIEINNQDADELNLKDNEKVKISSKNGSIVCTAKVTKEIKKGVTFMPLHFLESLACQLTYVATDPVSKMPDPRPCAVKIEKTEVR